MNHQAITLRQAAEKWMDSHPIVMDLFRRFAREMLAARCKFGISLLTERVRWECATIEGAGDVPRLNNSWRAYIIRRLVREMPELADLISCRVTKSANRPFKEPRFDDEVDPLEENNNGQP